MTVMSIWEERDRRSLPEYSSDRTSIQIHHREERKKSFDRFRSETNERIDEISHPPIPRPCSSYLNATGWEDLFTKIRPTLTARRFEENFVVQTQTKLRHATEIDAHFNRSVDLWTKNISIRTDLKRERGGSDRSERRPSLTSKLTDSMTSRKTSFFTIFQSVGSPTHGLSQCRWWTNFF